MKKIIAIQSNKLNEINIETDTTFLLALEAQKKGYQIIWYETKDLNLINSKIYILTCRCIYKSVPIFFLH